MKLFELFLILVVCTLILAGIYCICCILNLYNRVNILEDKMNKGKIKGKHLKLFEGED